MRLKFCWSMLETFISSTSPSLPMMSAIPCLSPLWLSLYFYCQYTTNHAPAPPAIMLTTCFLPHFGMFQRKVQLDLKMLWNKVFFYMIPQTPFHHLPYLVLQMSPYIYSQWWSYNSFSEALMRAHSHTSISAFMESHGAWIASEMEC